MAWYPYDHGKVLYCSVGGHWVKYSDVVRDSVGRELCKTHRRQLRHKSHAHWKKR